MRMRTNKATAVKVDNAKFRAIFAKKGITLRDASIECGFTPSYFSNQTSKTSMIAKSAAMLLESVYGIKPEDYAPDTIEKKAEQIVIQKSAEIDFNRLYQTIYKATYDGTMKAHEDWQARKLQEQKQPIPIIKREIASSHS